MITRRMLGAIASLPALGALASCAEAPHGRASRIGSVSDHFDGKRFFNPGGEGPRGLADFLGWQLGGGREPWPDAVPSPYAADVPPARVKGSGLRISFVGHATFLVQTGGRNILIDPVWSERASPFSFAGPRRHNPPGIAFDRLPPIDAILISHNHYDHLDVETLARLWRRDRPRIVAPLGNDAVIRGHDAAIEVTTLDWGDVVPLGPAVTAWAEPAHHWSARGSLDRNRALWASFVLRAPGGTIYYAGDTGFDAGRPFRHAAARHTPIDLALLPIGAYEPRWFMAPQHMNPEEAVGAMKLLGAQQALGYHWGTFRLTNEGADRPARDLAAALDAHGVEPRRFLAAQPGQVWSPGRAIATRAI